MVGCHQEIEEDSLRLGFWPLVNPNQLYWANQGLIRRWCLRWRWGSFCDYMVIIEARVSPLSHFSWRLGLKLINALPNSSIRWKVNCGQLYMIWWIWRWKWVRHTSFMLEQVLNDISKLKNEENQVRTKTAKNRKWLVIEVSKNGKFWTSKPRVQGSFKWKFVQHESCRSCSHLSKKSKNLKIQCMVGKLWLSEIQKWPVIRRP
jgi:hypothetical protein